MRGKAAIQKKEKRSRVPRGGEMKMTKVLLMGAALVLAGGVARANEPQTGTIVSENSVPCGSQLAKNKKTSSDLMCQEYVVRTQTTEYHVRQEKPAEKALIPVNTPVEFTLDKDKMKFKANGRKYEYLVVSEAAVK
jgi:hypothetical protein